MGYITAETLPGKTAEWLEKIKDVNVHAMDLTMDRAALLVIDMQDFFVNPASPSFISGAAAVVPNIRKLVHAFRGVHRPVIYTKHVHHPQMLDAGIMAWWWEGMCFEGSPESEIWPEIAPLANEKVIVKHRYSAFYNTDLETVLRCLGIEDIVISGTMTNMCCESTARDAYFRDYRLFFMADATGTVTEEMHLASLLNLAFGFALVTETDAIIRALS